MHSHFNQNKTAESNCTNSSPYKLLNTLLLQLSIAVVILALLTFCWPGMFRLWIIRWPCMENFLEKKSKTFYIVKISAFDWTLIKYLNLTKKFFTFCQLFLSTISEESWSAFDYLNSFYNWYNSTIWFISAIVSYSLSYFGDQYDQSCILIQ